MNKHERKQSFKKIKTFLNDTVVSNGCSANLVEIENWLRQKLKNYNTRSRGLICNFQMLPIAPKVSEKQLSTHIVFNYKIPKI